MFSVKCMVLLEENAEHNDNRSRCNIIIIYPQFVNVHVKCDPVHRCVICLVYIKESGKLCLNQLNLQSTQFHNWLVARLYGKF